MQLAPWDHARHCDALAAEVSRHVDTITGADLTRAVPTCPGWDIAELVRHVGSVHRWAARMVRDRATERLALADVGLDLPADATGLGAWLGAGGEAIVTTLRRADPDAPMWAWGADQHTRFWSRRMLHETTVHLADAELALDRDVEIDEDTASDGIDELLDNLPHARYFAPKVAELRGSNESLRFEATDAGARWDVHLRSDGFTWTRDDDGRRVDGRLVGGRASAEVRAPVGDLLLLLYRRLRPADPRFVRVGDEAVLSRWLENSALL